MECNKDEAARALEIAQRKLDAKDFNGASKFAAKAQQLYPPLEGLTQFMPILKVFIAADRKIEGELDWYAILQLPDDKAEDSVVKKQYRKMALLLHPDKNKIIGAEGAFKLVVEAWGVLSDKIKRTLYDQKRRSREFKDTQKQNCQNPAQNPKNPKNPRNPRNPINPRRYQPQKMPRRCSPTKKASAAASAASAAASAAAANVFANFRPTCGGDFSGFADMGSTASGRTGDSAFWTVCHYCGMQYEYLRVYQNRALLCRNCQKPFVAVEAVAIPVNYSGLGGSPWAYVPMGFANNGGRGVGFEGFSNAKFEWCGGFKGVNDDSSSAANVEAKNERSENFGESKEARSSEKIDKDCVEEGECDGSSESRCGKAAFSGPSKPSSSSSYAPSSPKGTSSSAKSHNSSDDPTVSYKKSRVDQCLENDLNSVEVKVEQRERRKEQEKKTFSEFAYSSKPDKTPAKHAQPAAKSVKDLLAEKAKRDILRSLSEVKRNAEMVAAAKEAAKEKATEAGRQEEDEVLGKALSVAKEEAKSPLKGKRKAQIEKNDVQNKVKKPRSDKNQSKVEKVVKSEIAEEPGLKEESIAVPDSDFYDFDNDRTENCFQASQVWATYDDENGLPRFYARIVRVVSLVPFKVQMSWLEPMLNKYQTCGGFKVGKVITCDTPNIFSHIMKWDKTPKCIFTIFPKKSDVWAVYKNWDSIWDEHIPAEIRHNYLIVEVLTDYAEEFGVEVVPLVKVSGFKTVFRRKRVSQPGAEWIVPKAELLRFSHQIPARRLTEEDALNIPEDCWELDPAATPIDMLTQGTTDAGENVAEAEELVAQAAEKAAESA